MGSDQHLLAAAVDGQIIDTVTLAMHPTLRHRGSIWAELEDVVVAPEHRGRGVETQLVQGEAMEIARATGAYNIHLVSNLAISDAYPFYEKLEFVHMGRGYKQ